MTFRPLNQGNAEILTAALIALTLSLAAAEPQLPGLPRQSRHDGGEIPCQAGQERGNESLLARDAEGGGRRQTSNVRCKTCWSWRAMRRST